MAAHYTLEVPAGGEQYIRLRLTDYELDAPFDGFDAVFESRKKEADAFYDALLADKLSPEQVNIARQCYAGRVCQGAVDPFMREWYMAPNGQIPAYEFNFSDVNPPVHAWAVWRVYKMTAPKGSRDVDFLECCFHKLILNFNWWVNRKDPLDRNIFAGGFLGLDNIGTFDRSKPLPDGGHPGAGRRDSLDGFLSASRCWT
eukprot:Em0003g647a